MNTLDDEFFKDFLVANPAREVAGIPNFDMNQPMAMVNASITGKIGLELEIEGARLPNDGHLERVVAPVTKASWTAVRDGSLRGEALEYILNRPCNEDEIDDLLEGLFEGFKQRGSVIENSNRCSTHVHINVQGLKVNQLTSIIALWSTFEEALIRWCGEERKTNHFCLSARDAHQNGIRAWQALLKNGYHGNDRNLKYSALNILPLWDKGSFEFRCGAAANDPVRPAMWAKFLYRMCDFAAKMYSNPQLLGNDLSERGGLDMFRGLADAEFFKQVFDMFENDKPRFDEACMEGFRNAQSIVYGFPWQDWVELCNREYVPNPFGKATKKVRARPAWMAEPEPLEMGALNRLREQVRVREVQEVVADRQMRNPPQPAPAEPVPVGALYSRDIHGGVQRWINNNTFMTLGGLIFSRQVNDGLYYRV